jgi:uncharacterized protein with GYD domain
MLYITQGSYSQSAIKGLMDNPQDRRAAVRKLVQAAGGKVVALYMTTGEYDFLLINDFKDGDTAVALGMVAAASGSVTNLKTTRAWTTADFKGVAEKAAKVAGKYSAPGS